jgi:selenocysteine lyase/cysteine desulfurase
MAVVSADFVGYDNAQVAYWLDKRFGIRTRCGLHCAPSAHKTLGTFPQGTVRFSPGHFNSEADIEKAVTAVRKVLKELESTRM